MKNKKLVLFTIIAISALLVLSGCSNAGISLELSPNPINFSENDTEKTLELTVTTEGIGNISLNNLIIEVIDENNENIFKDEKSIDISDQFIVGGFSDTVSYTLDLRSVFDPAEYDGYNSDTAFSEFYNGYLEGKTHKLRLTVTGSNNTSLTAQINYNE